jgi:serine/threonine protein kinase
MPIVDKLKGTVLDGRFKVKGKLSEGSFGQIYTGYDSKNRVNGIKNPIIIKFTQNHVMNDQEFEALIKVNEFAAKNNFKDSFSNTYTKGKCFIRDPTLAKEAEKSKSSKKAMTDEEKMVAKLETQVWSYIIQDKLGKTLEDYLFERNEAFTEKTTLQVGIQLLDSMRLIHQSGFLYNDLKLNNIVVGDAAELPDHTKTLHKIRVIDFGLAQKYIEADGNHIAMTKQGTFKGNIIFASKNAFNLLTQSRRDDLISLCYFLLYIIDGDLPFLQRYEDQ